MSYIVGLSVPAKVFLKSLSDPWVAGILNLIRQLTMYGFCRSKWSHFQGDSNTNRDFCARLTILCEGLLSIVQCLTSYLLDRRGWRTSEDERLVQSNDSLSQCCS